jgi:hypothetical protein
MPAGGATAADQMLQHARHIWFHKEAPLMIRPPSLLPLIPPAPPPPGLTAAGGQGPSLRLLKLGQLEQRQAQVTRHTPHLVQPADKALRLGVGSTEGRGGAKGGVKRKGKGTSGEWCRRR